MKRLLFFLAVLVGGQEALAAAGPRLLIQPRAVTPVIVPLVRPLALSRPLFDITFSRPGGAGIGGGWGTEPSSNGCTARTGSHTFTSVTFTADVGISIANGDCQGTPTIGVDTSVVDTFTSGTGAVSGTGAIGTYYFRTSTPAFYLYPATDAEYWALILPAGTGTSGGIPYFTSTADKIGSSAALTANMPVIGGGAGTAPAVGTVSGNTTQFVTTTGTQTSGDCVKIDANGNHIANGSACGGADPSTTLDVYDEFLAGNTTGGQVGSQGWGATAIATGTISQVASRAHHPGMISLNSHATNDNSGEVLHGSTSSTWPTTLYGADPWYMDAVIYFGGSGDGVTSSAFFFGLANSAANILTATDMIGIERDTDLSHTAFIGHVCDSSTSGCQSAGADTNQEVVTSTITPSDNTAYRFRITFDPVGGPGSTKKLTIQVNNETGLTFCSSGCTTTIAQFPSATALLPVIGYVTRTTTEVKSIEVDYWRITVGSMSRY